MTKARSILPGRTYLVTRRCTQGKFLLRPCRRTNNLLQYCLAYAAQETGIILHAVCFMSNHWHGVLSDPFARLPEFLERFHGLFARAQNSVLLRRENLWSSDKPSIVELVTEQDVIDKMAYALANPTSAGLVRSPDEWPGVITKGYNTPVHIAIPDELIDDAGDMPEEVCLSFLRPPAFQYLTDADFAQLLNSAVAKLVRETRAVRESKGQGFIGASAVLRQSFEAAPDTPPLRSNPPPFAAKDPLKRRAAMQRLRDFLLAYRQALLDWRGGRRDIVFPAGTYALRVHAGVACAPPATG